MKRRVFVGGAVSAASLLAAGERRKRRGTADIPRRNFGKTGESLTVIGMAGGRLHMVSSDDAQTVVRRAYDLGINYFDNAHAYGRGRSEEIYGQVLAPFRKHLFLTSKSGKRTRAEAEAELYVSMKRLRTDYIDLWQIHAVSEMEDVEKIFAPGGAMEAFEAAHKSGKVRFIGVTGHRDPEVIQEMLKRYKKFDSVMIPVHAADPAYLSFEKSVLPKAVKHGMGIQGMKNFANARLLSALTVRECLAYALTLPIHCTAVGCTTIGQLEDDVRAVTGFKPLDDAEMADLRKRAERVKGPMFEDWKRNVEVKAGLDPRPEYAGG